MPTMRDMALLRCSERFVDVVDHRPQIGPDRERVFEGLERLRAFSDRGRVPRLAERPTQARLFLLVALPEPIALGGERLLRAGVEPAGLAGGLGLLERFLDLEHLFEQLGRCLRLHRGAFARVAPFFEADQVFDTGERIAQCPVRGVEARGGFEDFRLALGCLALVEIRMAAARELIELSLQLGGVDAEPARQPEDLEVIHSPPLHAPAQNANGPSAGPVPCGSGPGYAENDVPHPQLDFALGLTKVKPPVSPCWT